ncbi:MAG: hypothetical protein H6831_07045 [Planctomycetes bacterium]|nr:hypothetical protein [Planctomycetota bacterium]MCB9904148.1 hypothetical protein [Planctomycetota bacterium]
MPAESKRVHRLRAETPVGHDDVLEGLWNAARRGRLPHALLFGGPEGIGKFLAAEFFVRGLACEGGIGPPCGRCGPCKRLLSGNYGDLHLLDIHALGKNEIRICYMTLRTDDASKKEMDGNPEDNVDTFLSLRAAEADWRIVLIRDADRMNSQAQNALLKNLEEPGERTLLVLVTSHPDRLLATIHSRCVHVGFEHLSIEECERITREHALSVERAGLLSRWSCGAPGEALELEARSAPALVQAIQDALTGASSPLVAARRAAETEGDFLGATDSARARHRAQVTCELALRVVSDRLRAAVGLGADELAFGAEVAGSPVGVTEESRLRAAVDDLLEARQDVERNMNADGILDRCFLALGRLAPPREPARAQGRNR